MLRLPDNIKRLYKKAQKHCVPIEALFELTHRCNLRCIHCYIDSEKKRELSTNGVMRALDVLSQNGTITIIFSGGEALLRPDIFDILKYAKKTGFISTLFTNGTLIDKSNVKRLIDTGVAAFEISVYSDIEKDHDEFTQVKGSFQAATGAVKLLKAGGADVTIKTVWNKRNYHRADSFLRLASDLGVELRGAPYLSVTNDGGAGHLNLRCSKEELVQFYTQVYERRKDRGNEMRKELEKKKYDYDSLKDKRICGACVMKLKLDPYGDVYPCVAFGEKLGNIIHDDFTAFWRENEFAKKFRALRVTDIKKCVGCDDYAFCRTCPADSLRECGDMLAPTDEKCIVAKAQREAFYKIIL